METVDSREQRSRRSCDICGSSHGREREERGYSDNLSRRIASDRDTVKNRRGAGGRDAGRGDCKCIVVYSGSGGERGREERLLKLSWDADSLW